MDLFLILSLSYLMGSIPFGLLITKLFLKKDIRKIGSGNIGATNVLRAGKNYLAYTTLVFDILKGTIPVFICKINFSEYIYYSAIFVLLGHIFPIWIKFKGGKGIATFIGILLAINYMYALIYSTIWILTNFIIKYSSLSSIISTIFITFFVLLFKENQNVYFYIIVSIIFLFTHRENIKRLINKTEPKTIFFKKK
tara:strand:+ start:1327 stop:1914 length:588 start_codon:yes stop_codon:yes gene_type:complete